MAELPVVTVPVKKLSNGKILLMGDVLACEEPLEIRLGYGDSLNRRQKNISVTMRTPGNDFELAAGFLFTEGIIHGNRELRNQSESRENIMVMELKEDTVPDLQKLDRNFYTSSSCGVCGKSSIDSVRTISSRVNEKESITVPATIFYSLPAMLRKTQSVFELTGGLHASALFDGQGNLLLVREDVGRHNALDKLIGYFLLKDSLPLKEHILLLSGRASFELIQKSAMAGIKIIACVGAPSSLAVELAKEFEITLVGFLREDRFNIYCGEDRIAVS